MTIQDEFDWLLGWRDAYDNLIGDLARLTGLAEQEIKKILNNPPNSPTLIIHLLDQGELVQCVNTPAPMQQIWDCLAVGGGVWAQVGRPRDLAWSTVRITQSDATRTMVRPWERWGKEGPEEELLDPVHKIIEFYLVPRKGT